MADQLAYAIVTPYTIRKSRTGAVLTRLLARTSTELLATQMLAPTPEFAARCAARLSQATDPEEESCRQLIRDYILENLSPGEDERRHRVLLLVFRGENAFEDIAAVVGRIRLSATTGETIRDTYGDLVANQDGSVRYFEPAVLTADRPDAVPPDLRMWLEFAESQPALLENVCVYEDVESVQRTLVLIKPDSLRAHSTRPGAIIDMFSRTGLRIIGCKLCRISVAQALDFYGPVLEALRRKLAPGIGATAREILERELDFELPDEVEACLTAQLGVPYAQDQFERIVEFMTGHRPSAVPVAAHSDAGAVRCLAVVYEGGDAVRKIRDVLGPTDPTKAPGGTVRREFGSDIMVNTAHASDGPENAEREMGILGMREGNLVPLVRTALEECHGNE